MELRSYGTRRPGRPRDPAHLPKPRHQDSATLTQPGSPPNTHAACASSSPPFRRDPVQHRCARAARTRAMVSASACPSARSPSAGKTRLIMPSFCACHASAQDEYSVAAARVVAAKRSWRAGAGTSAAVIASPVRSICMAAFIGSALPSATPGVVQKSPMRTCPWGGGD
jgi:hypothetical protein